MIPKKEMEKELRNDWMYGAHRGNMSHGPDGIRVCLTLSRPALMEKDPDVTTTVSHDTTGAGTDIIMDILHRIISEQEGDDHNDGQSGGVCPVLKRQPETGEYRRAGACDP